MLELSISLQFLAIPRSRASRNFDTTSTQFAVSDDQSACHGVRNTFSSIFCAREVSHFACAKSRISQYSLKSFASCPQSRKVKSVANERERFCTLHTKAKHTTVKRRLSTVNDILFTNNAFYVTQSEGRNKAYWKLCHCTYVRMGFTALITALSVCAWSQDLSVLRVHVVFSTAGFEGGRKTCPNTRKTAALRRGIHKASRT